MRLILQIVTYLWIILYFLGRFTPLEWYVIERVMEATTFPIFHLFLVAIYVLDHKHKREDIE